MRKSKIRKFVWLITKNHLQESQSNQQSHKRSNDNQESINIVSTNMMFNNTESNNDPESNPKNEVFRTIYR